MQLACVLNFRSKGGEGESYILNVHAISHGLYDELVDCRSEINKGLVCRLVHAATCCAGLKLTRWSFQPGGMIEQRHDCLPLVIRCRCLALACCIICNSSASLGTGSVTMIDAISITPRGVNMDGIITIGYRYVNN